MVSRLAADHPWTVARRLLDGWLLARHVSAGLACTRSSCRRTPPKSAGRPSTVGEKERLDGFEKDEPAPTCTAARATCVASLEVSVAVRRALPASAESLNARRARWQEKWQRGSLRRLHRTPLLRSGREDMEAVLTCTRARLIDAGARGPRRERLARYLSPPWCTLEPMTAMHPSRSYRGCGMCKPHKRRGLGRVEREPFAVRRQLGKSRRLSRGYVEDV